MIAGCSSVCVVTHTGASCDLGCWPWLCFRIGYKITINQLFGCGSVFVVTHTGASCDWGCSPWLCFGYKITITMNYLYSAFFCPPCQSLHDMFVCACMYIYDVYIFICKYMYVPMTAMSSVQSLSLNMSVKRK